VAAKKPLRINSVKRRAKHLRKILGNIWSSWNMLKIIFVGKKCLEIIFATEIAIIL
jgi:hypothetical protein